MRIQCLPPKCPDIAHEFPDLLQQGSLFPFTINDLPLQRVGQDFGVVMTDMLPGSRRMILTLPLPYLVPQTLQLPGANAA
jgi:hypothetical protein